MRAAPALFLLPLLALAPAQAEEPSNLDLVLALEQAFVDVAAGARGSVVTLVVRGMSASEPLPETAEELEDYLREHMPDMHRFGGMGSGFVADADGTIFTNAHVVAGADSVEVIFADGRRGKADVVGVDKGSDVAVVRLLDPPADLEPLPLGISADVRVGQFAVAIGSPLELESSFTVGHVSALHRREVGQSKGGSASDGFGELRYQDFIQVDTPINPGNSGGPLLDIRGRVIGINTAIYTGPGGGIGFSIPIDMVSRIGAQLVNGGKVRRGYLGVSMSELDPDLAELYGLDRANSVIIKKVEAGSPAEVGRFQEEDIVLEFGGEPIRSPNDLVHAIANSPIGEEIDALVFRTADETGRVALKVVLVDQEERPAPMESAKPPPPDRRVQSDSMLRGFGLELERADRKGGVRVSKVRAGSAADDAGLEVGDVILEVERSKIEAPTDVVDALSKSERPFVPLRYRRGTTDKITAIERRPR